MGIGVGALVLVGAAVMVAYILYKKKQARDGYNNEGYQKFDSEYK